MIETIVEKIIDPEPIRQLTISCGTKEIILTGPRFSDSEVKFIKNNFPQIKLALEEKIQPYSLSLIPDIELKKGIFFDVLIIRGAWWKWKS